MDRHIKEYYHLFSDETPQGNFHEVIALHEKKEINWKELSKKVPKIIRGWYELAHLSTEDRINFTHDFWVSKLPYRMGLTEFLDRFFHSLDEIGIYITEKKFADPYEVHLVYSLKGDNGFYRGELPILDEEQQQLQKTFPEQTFPADYLAFLQIHNGFCKTTDSTGIIPSTSVLKTYEFLQLRMEKCGPLLNSRGDAIDPKSLIPFYESFGMPFFQCFLSDWYPENEMGNIYYSGETHTISDIFSKNSSSETMAFPTFTDWLMFYMERIE